MSYITLMGLTQKLVLAGLSGCSVVVVWLLLVDVDNAIGQIAMYGSAGVLFMVGVLMPYARRGNFFRWRLVGLIVVSSVSFYCAVRTATEWSSGKWGPNLEDYVISSLVGASVVLLFAPALLVLRYSMKLAVAGVIAAVAGGLAFGFFIDLFAYSMFLSFGFWHLFMCVSLHVANPAAASDSWMAGWSGSRLGIAVGLLSLLIVVPLADDAIGALLQIKYTERNGGVRTLVEVNARGFSDPDCNIDCMTQVLDDKYAIRDSETTVRAVFGLYILQETRREAIRLSDDVIVLQASYFAYSSRFFGDTFGTVESHEEFLKQALTPVSGEPERSSP